MMNSDAGQQERIRTLLSDTIGILCKSSAEYQQTLHLEGLLALTLDDNRVVVVNLNEFFSRSERGVTTSSHLHSPAKKRKLEECERTGNKIPSKRAATSLRKTPPFRQRKSLPQRVEAEATNTQSSGSKTDTANEVKSRINILPSCSEASAAGSSVLGQTDSDTYPDASEMNVMDIINQEDGQSMQVLTIQPEDHNYNDNQEVLVVTTTTIKTQPDEPLIDFQDGSESTEDEISYQIIPGATLRGKMKLVDSLGYDYTLKRQSGIGNRQWQCSIRVKDNYCRATVSQKNHTFKRNNTPHNHDPPGKVCRRSTRRDRIARFERNWMQPEALGEGTDYEMIEAVCYTFEDGDS